MATKHPAIVELMARAILDYQHLPEFEPPLDYTGEAQAALEVLPLDEMIELIKLFSQYMTRDFNNLRSLEICANSINKLLPAVLAKLPTKGE